MPHIRNLMNKLVEISAKNSHITIDDFNPGLSREEIEQKVASLQLSFPEDVMELYTWKNGVNRYAVKGIMNLWPGGVFTPLEESIEDYKIGLKYENWPVHMFPIFNDGDIYYLIDLSKSHTGGMIFYHCPPITWTPCPLSIYDSLEIGLKTIIEEFKNGGYYFENGSISHGDDTGIIERNNPRSEFWKEEDVDL